MLRLLAYLGTRYSKRTVSLYTRTATDFLTQAGYKGAYGAEDVRLYSESLIERGLVKVSVENMLARVRCLFKANDWHWPESSALHLGMPESEPNAPVMDDRTIAALIRLACDRNRSTEAGAIAIALATVYGFRVSEIVLAMRAGCDGKAIDIQTSKAGRRRAHSIPPELAELLTFAPRKTSTRAMQEYLDRMLAAVGHEALDREGWHAIRRALVTNLFERGLTEVEIHRFMGWRSIGRTAFVYFRPTPEKLMQRVCELHPYLPIWREGLARG